MDLSRLPAPRGANRAPMVKGRGSSSGKGKTSTRGSKGATSRSGYSAYIGFEGGQMPLMRRIPKRGFSAKTGDDFQTISIKKISLFKSDTIIDPAFLKDRGLVASSRKRVKLLSDGNLKHPLRIKIHAASKNARAKIEAAGGTIEIIPFTTRPTEAARTGDK
jgi:large subunit ribosomal protein L15